MGNRQTHPSTFAQLAADKAADRLERELWKHDRRAAALGVGYRTGGAAKGAGDAFEIEIFNTNTGVTAGSRMRVGP